VTSAHGAAAHQAGMTLIEVLIAVAIVGVGLVALSAAVPLAAYAIHEGNRLSAATFLAEQRLEQARRAPWQVGPACVDDLGVSPSSHVAPASSCAGATTFPDEPEVAPPYAGFSRAVRIAGCDAGGACNGVVSADLRQVTVTVSYRPMTGAGLAPASRAKAATVTMLVARR